MQKCHGKAGQVLTLIGKTWTTIMTNWYYVCIMGEASGIVRLVVAIFINSGDCGENVED